MAKSRAGEGSVSIPYQLRTLDRQVPQFKFLSPDNSCLNDHSCLIKWVVDTDGGSPISRAEISFGKVRKRSTGNPRSLMDDLGEKSDTGRSMVTGHSHRTIDHGIRTARIGSE